jgi:hypothetical protein
MAGARHLAREHFTKRDQRILVTTFTFVAEPSSASPVDRPFRDHHGVIRPEQVTTSDGAQVFQTDPDSDEQDVVLHLHAINHEYVLAQPVLPSERRTAQTLRLAEAAPCGHRAWGRWRDPASTVMRGATA